MDISTGQWALYWNIAQSLVTAALVVTVWLRKPGEDAGKAVAALRQDIAARDANLSVRLTRVETEMRQMPSDAELIRLEGAVKEGTARTEGLTEAVSTIRVQLNRIENYLLSAKQ